MPTLTVRNIDEATLAELKRRAQAGHRSLEAEVREILTRASTPSGDDLLAEIRAIHDRILARRAGRPLPTDSARMLADGRERV
jgi:plasmid stability protein